VRLWTKVLTSKDNPAEDTTSLRTLPSNDCQITGIDFFIP
jgi:hypothetical protein